MSFKGLNVLVTGSATGLGAEVVDDHLRAVRGQHQRVLAADAAACACHDCNSSLTQTGHLVSIP